MDLLSLSLLGGLLALDGTSFGQFMVSRPLVAGVLTGWAVGDPALGLLVGGILEVYFISVFPVGGAEFPEGGPPTVSAVAAAAAIGGPAGLALGASLGFLLSRLGFYSTRMLRKINGRIAPNPARREVTAARMAWAHLICILLDFSRGSVVTLFGVLAGFGLAELPAGAWPLEMPGTLVLLAVGASIPAGAFLGSLGGWRKGGLLFGAGIGGFLLATLIL